MPLLMNNAFNAPLPPWDLTGFVYDSSFSTVSFGNSRPVGVEYNQNGTKAYVIDATSHIIYQYALSVPYEITAASATLETTKDVVAQTNNPSGGSWSSNGLFYYVVAPFGQMMHAYEPTIPFNASTLVYNGTSISLNSLTGDIVTPKGVTFSHTGDRMYVVNGGSGVNGIYQFDLSTSWLINTAVYNSVFVPAVVGRAYTGIKFQADGYHLSVSDNTSDNIYTYTMSAAWDISTATLDPSSIDITSEENYPEGLVWRPDGTAVFIAGFGSGAILKYVKV